MSDPATPQATYSERAARLHALGDRLFRDHRLIIASNRGPVEYEVGDDGMLRGHRGSGGVVTALSAVANHVPLTWVSAAMTEADHLAHAMAERGQSFESPALDNQMRLRLVAPPRQMYERHYNVFCNPLLWFIQHYMWNTPRMPNVGRAVYDAWEHGYVAVNQMFADAIVEEAAAAGDDECYVMVHDYHLYLMPGQVRQRLPRASIHHFTHIPWPDPRYWQLLPAFMRSAIHQQMCESNIVGFQTQRDVRNFLFCCEAFLDATADYRLNEVTIGTRTTRVVAYPISVDAAGLEELAGSPEAASHSARLAPYFEGHTIVRVDRLEPSKNILRGLRAFELLLQRQPELRGNTRMLAFLVPSRSKLPFYQTYTEEVFETVGSINDEWGDVDWTPIQVFYENNYVQAIAAMRDYDVLMVNPVIDGMNLVSKEGVLVNRRDGVLVLSETAGSFEQLSEGCVPVAPADIEGTVRALREALEMPLGERRRRAAVMREAVRREDIIDWITRQLADLATLQDRRHAKLT